MWLTRKPYVYPRSGPVSFHRAGGVEVVRAARRVGPERRAAAALFGTGQRRPCPGAPRPCGQPWNPESLSGFLDADGMPMVCRDGLSIWDFS